MISKDAKSSLLLLLFLAWDILPCTGTAWASSSSLGPRQSQRLKKLLERRLRDLDAEKRNLILDSLHHDRAQEEEKKSERVERELKEMSHQLQRLEEKVDSDSEEIHKLVSKLENEGRMGPQVVVVAAGDERGNGKVIVKTDSPKLPPDLGESADIIPLRNETDRAAKAREGNGRIARPEAV
ncbi:unnamed protein product [Darwinula stevensoni]|uniref:Uncharacterized protein n=1 Tax=Darwinula stevensoni TaxID=69355 RepID=A0A7R9AHI6_9CRUS|nr:unnamed protein product [Darwinula stevensoni]CAG0905593.1 unnamed protein product [Darwinula stevensoni]